MPTQIVLDLPDEVVQRAERRAQATRKAVSSVLSQAVERGLPVEHNLTNGKRVEELSDREVLNLAAMRLDAETQEHLSELLYLQQAGTITRVQQDALASLNAVCEEGQLLKAQAMAEAVKRQIMILPAS
jgi:hypothetical protein